MISSWVSRRYLCVYDDDFGAGLLEQPVDVHAVVVYEEVVGHLDPLLAEHVSRNHRDRGEAPVDDDQVRLGRERLDDVAAQRAPVEHQTGCSEAVADELGEQQAVLDHVLHGGAAGAVSVAPVVPEETEDSAVAVQLDGFGLVGDAELVQARVRETEQRDGAARQLARATRGHLPQLFFGDLAEGAVEHLAVLEVLGDQVRPQRERVVGLVRADSRHQQVAVYHGAVRGGHLHPHARVRQAALDPHLVKRAERLLLEELREPLEDPHLLQARSD